jgi:hypothetical protein
MPNVPNWKQVTPEEKRKLGPLVRHYRKFAHPFTKCVADNTKRFGRERAEKVCAVLKDVMRRSTKWRESGAKASAVSDHEVEAQFDAVWAPALQAAGVERADVDAWLAELDAAAEDEVEAAWAREWLTGRR